ncbi:LPXTG cell wall anchor domain-containing protein [Streptomyces sp. NBC_01591]|uniref:SCO1860 family LAETG-anchored protein n=1 Tax=Streptomyces sp. NBC_01591 TaxID=2975888 RepID=UPI002DDBA640|nr:SCO1860 family LAETG-anchored protein [Streptomyces sp. NBC_01591]WSD67723.1 LPXTG cell wall anchor domain-containing protein [Streptomyces sp. NBC_01591]
MNSNTFRLAALAVAAAPVALLVAVPAQAATATTTTTGDGKASAVVLRTALDVSLLNKTVDVPLKATLNEVQAPADAKETALSVRLDGVEGGRPVSVLAADVATANATVDKHRAEGYSNVAKARVHVPGLPLLSLIEVEKVTSKAVCEVGRKPVAESNVLGHVSVLGKRINLTAGGTTQVTVPGVGEVTLDLSKTHTTSRTAAATALQLKVSVNPLKLNVADVRGEITLAEATCETPKPSGPGGGDNGGSSNGGSSNGGSTNGGSTNGGSSSGGSSDGGSGNGGSSGGGSSDGGTSGNGGSTTGSTSGGGVKPQTGTDHEPAVDSNLAETGGSSTTPYIAGGAAVLLAAGAGAVVVARRRAQG